MNAVPEEAAAPGPFARLGRLASSNRAMTVGDQMLLSAANLLTSLVVVKVAGPALFGVYSVVLVVVTLACGAFSALVSGQMMLAISARGTRVREALLRATVGVQAGVLAACTAPLLLLWLGSGASGTAARLHVPEVLAGALLVVALSGFELFRRYLYVIERFRLSFALTCLFAAVHVAGTALVVLRAPAESVVVWVLVSLATGYAAAVALNLPGWRGVARGKRLGAGAVRAMLARYWDQGRFGFSGLALTWVQNQSLSIVLLWYASATTVGYFNLGRLVMMPVTVFNTGLLNGLTPQFRRMAVGGRPAELARAGDRQGLLSVGVLGVWMLVLGAVHATGLLERFVDYADEVWPFVLAWALITGLTTFRSWLSQFFIAFVDFRFLLRASLVSAATTAALAGASTAVGAPALAFAFAIAAGEIVSAVLIRRRRARALAGEVAVAVEGPEATAGRG